MKRRTFMSIPFIVAAHAARGDVAYPRVEPGTALTFPRDHGSHPDFRTEWWYLTGWVRDARGDDLGIQVTFFRNRPGVAEDSASRFAPKQLLFAHAAIADPRLGRLRHDQRAARAAFDLAVASAATTDVRIDDWSLRLDGTRYITRIEARDFALDLAFAAKGPVLPQGAGGFSRKGPRLEQASHYYSRPHLAVTGVVSIEGVARDVQGTAWLDHEWSSAYLAAEAPGWDWTGINFEDGGALMAFRIRDRAGGAYWAGGAYRNAAGATRVLEPGDVHIEPVRWWRSPRTGIAYPVSVRVRAGALEIVLEPLFDDQELDSRASVGTIYWEGAVRALSGGGVVGRGYLELTGYGAPLKI
jgi:predicted secreted hydrolase